MKNLRKRIQVRDYIGLVLNWAWEYVHKVYGIRIRLENYQRFVKIKLRKYL